MLKKIILNFLIVISIFILSITIKIEAKTMDIEPELNKETIYDTDSNYYGKVDDKTKISNPSLDLLTSYKKIAEVNGNSLYLDTKKLNIAMELKNGYIFSSVDDYYGFNIEAYLVTGGLSEVSSTLLVDGKYKSSMMDKSESPLIEYDFSITNGFKASIIFESLGITINVYVSLDENGNLNVRVPKDEIIENGYVKETTTLKKDESGNYVKDENGKYIKETTTSSYEYYLSSFTLFPYFGAVGETTNYSNIINGYNFIPDGSGALVRYQYDVSYSTRFSKRIYGNDYGIKDDIESNNYLSKSLTLDIPIYGVNHGYNQQAFINVINEGDGASELYLEPYGYSGRKLQTSYYKFYLRETYNVALSTKSSGSTVTLNKEKYNTDYSFTYSFLYGDDANYSGMARYYKNNYLSLTNNITDSNIELGLNVLAQDYKKGLFFKKFIKMTTYNELLDIIKDLEINNVSNFSISYKGMNSKGFYNNSSYKPKISHNLGSKNDYNNLINYINDNGYNLEYVIDVLSSYKESSNNIVKKYNLELFNKSSSSTLFDETYLYNIDGSIDKITKYNKKYQKLNISSINLTTFGENIYSYRYDGYNYSRDEVIDIATSEISKISDTYNLSLYKAYSYLYNYIDRLYENETSSSLYTYYTDSVPFISLILSGHVSLFSKEINFISDYNQYCLRLIEYNIYPYFIITNNENSLLRYTNSENIYTSEYSLWKDTILKFYEYTNDSLKNVIGSEMINHEYIIKGVSISTYSNGAKIYVNHNNYSVNVDGINIDKLSYEVVK